MRKISTTISFLLALFLPLYAAAGVLDAPPSTATVRNSGASGVGAAGQTLDQALSATKSADNILSGSLGPGVNAGSATVKATGSTTPGSLVSRTLAAHVNDVVNVMDYGAVCDGQSSTNDGPAINAALSALRNQASPYRQKVLAFPYGARCDLSQTLNFTNMPFELTVLGNGVELQGHALTGAAVIDAVESSVKFYNMRVIYSDSVNQALTGIQTGRTQSASSGGGVSMYDVFIDGYFSEAGFYGRANEVCSFIKVNVTNRSNVSTAFAVIQDGNAHFPIVSAFVTDNITPNSSMSFNENNWIASRFDNRGTGSAFFISGANRHSYLSSFARVQASVPAAIFWLSSSSQINLLTWDVHAESAPTSDIQLQGTTNAVLNGFTYRNHLSQATSSILSLGSGVSTGAIYSADIQVGGLLTSGVPMVDTPSVWTVSGRLFLPSYSVNNINSGGFSGVFTYGTVSNYFGSLAGAAFPNTLSANSLVSAGGVSSISATQAGGYYSQVPSVNIGSPASGTTATAHVATLSIFSVPASSLIISPGTGYSVGDKLALPGYTTTAGKVNVTAVDGSGAITAITGFSGGVYPTIAPTYALVCSPCANGAAATGAVISAPGFRVSTVVVDTPGSGYASAPPVTLSGGAVSGGQTATATLSSLLTLSGGSTSLNIGNGYLSNNAPYVEGTCVRQSLGATYTVPATTGCVRFVQGTTVSNSTVALPTPLADGQAIQFVNYAGPITALTFSPTVLGWTNGSTLAAYTGLRIRWDATSAAWIREQ